MLNDVKISQNSVLLKLTVCKFIKIYIHTEACDDGYTYVDGSCRISCVGNNDCCNGKKCVAGEGDCDNDGQCGNGLKCGKDNCLNAIFNFGNPFGSQDDCCEISV